jgi:predicted nucleic acid-binding protein
VRFVDTNVLLYAVSTDPAEATKTELARALLDSGDLALSVQVLQEFYVQATRTSRLDRLTHDQASALIEAWLRFPAQEITVTIVRAAATLAHTARIAYWDAAVIESARALGCQTVLSEDLADGRDYSGVRVDNPFRTAA